jgi:hypothetical protein
MSDIIGFEACAKELRRLLDAITETIKAAGANGPDALHAAVLTETKKLVEFTNRTEAEDLLDAAEVESVRQIDQMAADAMAEIFGDSANTIIGRLYGRISQLNQLEKTIRQQAAENEREARKLRLIPVRDAIDTVTETVGALSKAKDALSDEDADEAAVKTKIEAALRAIAALDKAVRDL